MTLESELREEHVSHLDLSGFSRVVSGMTVRDVMSQMRAERHNACLITDADDKLVGIFTDRDVLRKVVNAPQKLDAPIDEVMTKAPVTIRPDLSAAAALRTMDENHFRNLPAVDENGAILGDMTHQSIINFLAARYPVEILNRPPDPDRFPRKPEGG
ncbi:MAG: CBS domain-containing protein [Caldilineaceae bacterium]